MRLYFFSGCLITSHSLIQTLVQVYVSRANIDDDLVSSIVDPAQDPNAPDVFYRVISSNGASINSLLQKVKVRIYGLADPSNLMCLSLPSAMEVCVLMISSPTIAWCHKAMSMRIFDWATSHLSFCSASCPSLPGLLASSSEAKKISDRISVIACHTKEGVPVWDFWDIPHLSQAPLFLLWGELDPWITPASADRIQKIFPAAKRVDIRGGHCPHDDVPELFLPPLKSWLEELPSTWSLRISVY